MITSSNSVLNGRWWIAVFWSCILPFLEASSVIWSGTLLSLLADPQKPVLVQLGIATTIDWEELLVKACGHLEARIWCYSSWVLLMLWREYLLPCIQQALTPNLQAIGQQLSGVPTSYPSDKQLMVCAKACEQPDAGWGYSQNCLQSSLYKHKNK